MKLEKKDGSIVSAGNRALTVRASALVARGVADLSLKSPWLERQIFDVPQQLLGLSPQGTVCTYSNAGHEHTLIINDIEDHSGPFVLPLTARPVRNRCPRFPRLPWIPSVSWSPCGRYLAVPLAPPEAAVWVLDARERQILFKKSLECLPSGIEGVVYLSWSKDGPEPYEPNYSVFRQGTEAEIRAEVRRRRRSGENPVYLVWSKDGRYLASAWWQGGKGNESNNHGLRLWEFHPPLNGLRHEQQTVLDDIDLGGLNREWREEFGNIHPSSFSPDSKYLALNQWNPVFLDVQGLRYSQGHDLLWVDDMSWTADSRHVICTVACEQVARIDIATLAHHMVPLFADCCRCNPVYNVGAFCHSVQRGEERKGPYRLYFADLDDFHVIAEWNLPTFGDMQWCADGSKLYVISPDGRGYVFKLIAPFPRGSQAR